MAEISIWEYLLFWRCCFLLMFLFYFYISTLVFSYTHELTRTLILNYNTSYTRAVQKKIHQCLHFSYIMAGCLPDGPAVSSFTIYIYWAGNSGTEFLSLATLHLLGSYHWNVLCQMVPHTFSCLIF